MKLKLLFLISFLFIGLTCKAKNKTQASIANLIDINDSSNGKFFRAQIAIKPLFDQVYLRYHYDELVDLPIHTIAFIVNTKKIFPNGENLKINSELEKQSIEQDPIKAYDRELKAKHIYTRDLMYSKILVLGKKPKYKAKNKYQIEVYYGDGSKSLIDISSKLWILTDTSKSKATHNAKANSIKIPVKTEIQQSKASQANPEIDPALLEMQEELPNVDQIKNDLIQNMNLGGEDGADSDF